MTDTNPTTPTFRIYSWETGAVLLETDDPQVAADALEAMKTAGILPLQGGSDWVEVG